MSCSSEKKKESYQFFEDIGSYIEKANLAEITDILTSPHKECDSFMNSNESYFTDKETAKIICEQFLKLYVSLTDLKTKPKSDTNYKKSNGFLNYWVNFKLIKSIKKEDYTVHDVYDHLESQVFNIDGYDIHLNLICDIDKDELHKMNILYNLFENYGKLNAIKYDNVDEAKQALYLHSTACCTDYNKAKYICNGNNKVNNPKFCDKLETFESQYEQLYSEVLQKGSHYSNNLIKLSECPNNKIITAVTGSIVGLIPLLGVLYKFTPMGQMFRSKKGILNNDISNNDEEMIKMSLMEQGNEQLKFHQGTYNIKYQSL